MADFNVDLSPKKSAMDLGDLLKMDEAMAKRKIYDDAVKSKAPKVVIPIKMDPTDKGVPFKFGNNYQSED